MDWNDSAEQAAFRAQVREFIAAQLPDHYRQMDDTSMGHSVPWYRHRASEDEQLRNAAKDWADALAERGWIAPHWPKEYGGADLTTMEQFIFAQEMTIADAPQVGGNGVMMLGPTIIVHGSDEQKARLLPNILSGEIAWAQGYSEPGAGSDLASLSTRAVRDGDEYVINGQKIWTTNADVADAVFVLVRTDPDAPKHRGISLLLCEDIHAPGITVRPLVDMGWQIDVTESFYDDVRVPANNLIGDENRGWYVAMTLLNFERSGVTGAASNGQALERLLRHLDTDEGQAVSRVGELPTVRAAIADRYIEAAVGLNFTTRIASMQAAGLVPTVEASVGKLFNSTIAQTVQQSAMKAFGLYATLWPGDPRAPANGRYTRDYVRNIPRTIAGGSNEIQRGIIATRGLGLPRS